MYNNLGEHSRLEKLTCQYPHTRCNLSFSSKYIHFLSGRELPIYDSYIWLVMNGYKSQANSGHFSFSTPKTYKEFFEQFLSFREEFNLENISSYDLDKFLWQYGKNLITGIMKEQDVTMGKAKTILKNRITSSCSEPG